MSRCPRRRTHKRPAPNWGRLILVIAGRAGQATVAKLKAAVAVEDIQRAVSAVPNGAVVDIQLAGAVIARDAVDATAVEVHGAEVDIPAVIEVQHIAGAGSCLRVSHGQAGEGKVMALHEIQHLSVPGLHHDLRQVFAVAADGKPIHPADQHFHAVVALPQLYIGMSLVPALAFFLPDILNILTHVVISGFQQDSRMGADGLQQFLDAADGDHIPLRGRGIVLRLIAAVLRRRGFPVPGIRYGRGIRPGGVFIFILAATPAAA